MTSNNNFKVWWKHFCQPWQYLNFYGYFFGLTVFCGGLGVFYSIYQQANTPSPNWWQVSIDITSYSMALLFPSLVNILGDDESEKNGKIIWTIIFFILLPIGFTVLAILTHCYIFPIGCLLLSMFAWIVGNYNNKSFYSAPLEENVSQQIGKIQEKLDEDE